MVVAGLAVLTVVILALSVIPVPQSYSFSYGTYESGNAPVSFEVSSIQSLCPAGAHAYLSFTSNGLNITWAIFAPNGTSIWGQHGADANVSLSVASCGWYRIYAAGSGDGAFQIDGTVSYSAPIL